MLMMSRATSTSVRVEPERGARSSALGAKHCRISSALRAPRSALAARLFETLRLIVSLSGYRAEFGEAERVVGARRNVSAGRARGVDDDVGRVHRERGHVPGHRKDGQDQL